MIRPYLCPIRTSKKLGLYLKFLPVTQDHVSISIYLSVVLEGSFIERIVLLIRLLLLYLVDGSLQALLIYKLPFPAFFPPLEFILGRNPGYLFSGVSHFLHLAACIPLVSLTLFV